MTMTRFVSSQRLGIAVLLAWVGYGAAAADDQIYAQLPKTVKLVEASIVAVGTLQTTRRPPALFKGTGFVFGDGNHVLTNAHVVDPSLDSANKETLAVFIRKGEQIESRAAEIIGRDPAHDVAILRFQGRSLPALRLYDGARVPVGSLVVFTGFPIGSVLGLYPVTHRGIVSAHTPIAIPQLTTRQLDTKLIRKLQDGYFVYQLDATAYPGNSGSPVYDPLTGTVLGIVSSVFVKDSKERVLQDPSGISFAVPINHAVELKEQLN